MLCTHVALIYDVLNTYPQLAQKPRSHKQRKGLNIIKRN